MAKFRRAHQKRSTRLFPPYLKIISIIGVILLIFLVAKPLADRWTKSISELNRKDLSDLFYLPEPASDPIYLHGGFTLAYNESTEQASWVAYELTIQHLNAPKVPRTNYFREDVTIPTKTATFSDYKNSGYTKGHLVPAADRAYSNESMEETFLMSNISPQVYACNGGIWRELEEQTRDWARQNKALYIICGPIFPKEAKTFIGNSRVAVPTSFFKVILDATEPSLKGIGFEIPNALSTRPLQTYARSIDDIEAKTGIDFFPDLFTDNLEDSLENEFDLSQWKFNEKRYQTRIKYWNNR